MTARLLSLPVRVSASLRGGAVTDDAQGAVRRTVGNSASQLDAGRPAAARPPSRRFGQFMPEGCAGGRGQRHEHHRTQDIRS